MTPQGRLVQASTSWPGGAHGSTSISSVEPPPMSNTRACPPHGSMSAWQPSTASRASSPEVMTSSAMPVSR
jgi:hypothetical protein